MCGASTQDFVNFETCAAQRYKCDSIGKSIRASTDELPGPSAWALHGNPVASELQILNWAHDSSLAVRSFP